MKRLIGIGALAIFARAPVPGEAKTRLMPLLGAEGAASLHAMLVERMLAAAGGDVFELLTAPRGAPDDLAKLTGVGPQLVKKLNDAGVFHYWQLAALTAADAEKLDADLKLNGRIARDSWIDQARTLLSA